MTDVKVAKRYAKALLDLAKEQGIAELINKDMIFILKTCEAIKALAYLMRNPIVNPDKKLSILKQIFEKKLNKLSFSFIEIILRKRREIYIETIAKEFIETYKKHKGIETAIITSASGLDEKLRKEVIEIVKNSVKSEVELVEKVDKRLIGGLILRVGDMQYDLSIAKSLKKLTREFNTNPYTRKN